MKFKPYTSIENHYREKYIEILREYGFDKDVRWVAHEKIHGSNFSFITDGKVVSVASRNNVVNGDFYHCQAVIDKYTQPVLNLKNIEYPKEKQIQIYGELFGPGIQSGVFYGHNKEFMAFELVADDEIQYFNIATRLLAKHGIKHAPFLGVFQSLDEGLALDNTFVSKVYDELYPPDAAEVGFVQFSLGENDAEGFVLKPAVDALFTPNGSRVIIKSKATHFAEKTGRSPKKPSEPNPFIPVVEQYVNQNRLDAVISKEGELTPRDFGRIIKLMAEDVIIDMIKDDDLPVDWKKQEEFKIVGKAVSMVVAKFLKSELLPRL